MTTSAADCECAEGSTSCRPLPESSYEWGFLPAPCQGEEPWNPCWNPQQEEEWVYGAYGHHHRLREGREALWCSS